MRNQTAKISPWQCAILLFLSRMLSFFLASPQRIQPGPISFCLLLPLSAAVTGLFLLPAWRFCRRYPGMDLLSAARVRWGGWGNLLPAGFFLLAQMVLIQTVSAFSAFLNTAAYPETSPWLFILLLMAAAAYGAFMGREPVARFSAFVFAAFLLTVVFVGLTLLPQLQWDSLSPPAYDSRAGILRLFVTLTAGNVEGAALILLWPCVREKASSVYWRFSGMTVVVLSLSVLFTSAALGDYGATQRFPFFTVTKVAETTLFQRLDSLHIALWVFLAVLRLALFLQMAGRCLSVLLPTLPQRMAVLLSAGIAALIAGCLSRGTDGLSRMADLLSGGLPGFLCLFLLPLLLCLVGRRGGAER